MLFCASVGFANPQYLYFNVFAVLFVVLVAIVQQRRLFLFSSEQFDTAVFDHVVFLFVELHRGKNVKRKRVIEVRVKIISVPVADAVGAFMFLRLKYRPARCDLKKVLCFSI